MDKPKKQWMGLNPENCDLCNKPITDIFIDGQTRNGHWANMCDLCFQRFGLRLGTGSGQKYRKSEDGVYYKEEG